VVGNVLMVFFKLGVSIIKALSPRNLGLEGAASTWGFGGWNPVLFFKKDRASMARPGRNK